MTRYRFHLALFAIGFAVFGAMTGRQLFHQSSAPHYVYQADAWLKGQLSIDEPVTGDDWARVETVTLDDGTTARGRRMMTQRAFRTTGGDEIPLERIKPGPIQKTTYMSFPPLPSLLMLPGAALGGRAANDVFPTVLVAALCLPLMLLVLERLGDAGLAARGRQEQLWLVAMFAFGTVFFFSSVIGQVWYTAHVVGVALCLVYAWAAIEARRPIVAGVALGCAAITRPPMAFMFPLFAFEAWRVAGGLEAWRADRKQALRALAKKAIPFAAPVVLIAIAAAAYNVARFGSPGEFGHNYLEVVQQQQMERYGLFSYHYLERQLTVAFTLLPELPGRAPWIQVSGQGLALWVTTPAFLLLLWPREKNALHRTLWITVALVAIPTFFYQNSGWVQFGYRFSLDYTVFLVMLLAIGGRRLGVPARALIAVGVVVNLLGAYAFAHDPRYLRVDPGARDHVVEN
jgi:hypothetical protein